MGPGLLAEPRKYLMEVELIDAAGGASLGRNWGIVA